MIQIAPRDLDCPKMVCSVPFPIPQTKVEKISSEVPGEADSNLTFGYWRCVDCLLVVPQFGVEIHYDKTRERGDKEGPNRDLEVTPQTCRSQCWQIQLQNLDVRSQMDILQIF